MPQDFQELTRHLHFILSTVKPWALQMMRGSGRQDQCEVAQQISHHSTAETSTG